MNGVVIKVRSGGNIGKSALNNARQGLSRTRIGIPPGYAPALSQVLETMLITTHPCAMSDIADYERLKKRIEKDHTDILALQERIRNIARMGANRSSQRDDSGIAVPAAPSRKEY